RVETIANWPTPRNIHDVQVFLGFVNFYRRFIEGYSHIARPLTDLMKGGVGTAPKAQRTGTSKTPLPWHWTDACEKAFTWLKTAFTTATILAHFDPLLRSRVETDTSKYAIAAIFSQLQPTSQWRPVAFWSRKLKPAET